MDKQERTATLSRGAGKGLFGSVLPAFFASALLSAALLLLCALLLTRSEDPGAYIRVFGLALPAVCAFFGGFIAGKREKNMGALCGLITGVLFLLALLVLSFFLGSGTMTMAVRIVCYTLLLLLSTLGGLAGSTGGRGRKKSRHRHR